MAIVIDNCKFEFLCEKQWDELTETGEQDVRFCNKCQSNVYYCDNRDQLDHAIRLDRCVAIDSGLEIQGRSGRLLGWMSM